MNLPGFQDVSDSALITEVAALDLMATQAKTLIHLNAVDLVEEQMLVEMLGLNEQPEDPSHLPLTAGFGDRAARQRLDRKQHKK